jgi:hypothetical protein
MKKKGEKGMTKRDGRRKHLPSVNRIEIPVF